MRPAITIAAVAAVILGTVFYVYQKSEEEEATRTAEMMVRGTAGHHPEDTCRALAATREGASELRLCLAGPSF